MLVSVCADLLLFPLLLCLCSVCTCDCIQCFIFCTIVNPIVPVAWLFFLEGGGGVIQFALRVCVCGRQVFFLHRGDLWYEPVWVLWRVPNTQFFLNTVTTLAKHVHNDRMEETKIYCLMSFFRLFLSFFHFVSRTETQSEKRK